MQAAVRGDPVPTDPPIRERWQTALTQYRSALVHYGTDLGRRVIRKHLGWYADSIANDKALRDQLVRAGDPEPLLARLAAGHMANAA
jgi:tRNA-dihydrouridine synthase